MIQVGYGTNFLRGFIPAPMALLWGTGSKNPRNEHSGCEKPEERESKLAAIVSDFAEKARKRFRQQFGPNYLVADPIQIS